MIKEIATGAEFGAGPKIYQLTYKAPVKVIPPVNGFLILADVPVLIDGGTSDDATWAEFNQDLASIGLKTSDIREVLVTHNHADHIGVASRLAAADKTLKVHCHEYEWYMVGATDSYREELRDILCSIIVTWGVPRDIVMMMRSKIVQALRHGGGVPVEQLVAYPQGKFKVAGLELEAILCKGHTDGLVCLWWPERGFLFSNDQVLEDVTPNPTLYLKPRGNRLCGLKDYLDGMKAIENLPVKLVMPGHGEVFTDLRAMIKRIHDSANKRRAKLLENLKSADAEPANILHLTQKVWGEMDPVNTFLGAREIHGFLEMLTEEGLVQSEIVDETSYYSLVKRSATDTKLEHLEGVS